MPLKFYKPITKNKTIIINGSQKSHNSDLCIFAYHNPFGVIPSIHKYHISELSNAKMDILFVSAGQLLDEEIEKIRPFVSKIIIRNSFGRDFGSYYQAFSIVKDFRKYFSVLFLNDSIYGPFYSLNKILDIGKKKECDIFGITD